MLYVLIEAQRAWLDKVQKDNELAKQETRIISEDRKSVETEPYGPGVLRPSLAKEPVSSLYPCQINDSEWFTLSPQKRLAWAKESKDPRISEGQRSPLEKKILRFGGVHTTAARHLLTQKYHEESKALCKEQAYSLDYWLAKAESYYNKRIVDMMKKDTGGETKTKVEEEPPPPPPAPAPAPPPPPPRTEKQKQHYWVPEREKKQIERHIHRTGQAREFKDKPRKQTQLLSEITLPKIMLERQSIPKAQKIRQAHERELLQIKDHRERMIRGRELLQQRLKEKTLRKSLSQKPLPEKHDQVKKQSKEFERVVAYPLFQPSSTSRIKVDILVEKSQDEEDLSTIIRPFGRRFLAVPPFLRTQIGKIKNP